MHVAQGRIGDPLMRHDHFSRVTSRLEGNGDAFGHVRFRLETPGVNEFSGSFDRLELAGDPQDFSVRELVGDAVATADAQIDFCVDTDDGLGAPPFLELLGLRPGVEEPFGRGADRFANDESDRWRR